MERRKNDLETKMMGVLAGLRGETLTFYQLPLRMRFGNEYKLYSYVIGNHHIPLIWLMLNRVQIPPSGPYRLKKA